MSEPTMDPEALAGLSDEDVLGLIQMTQSVETMITSLGERNKAKADPEAKASHASLADEASFLPAALAELRTEAMRRGLTEPTHHLDDEAQR